MNRIRMKIVALFSAAALSLPLLCAAQPAPAQAPPAVPAPAPPAPPAPEIEASVESEYGRHHWGRPALRIGQDYTLRAGDVAGEVLVIAGTATIEGRVDHDVVVVFGRAHLSSTASIDGSLVVAGGSAVIAPGAAIRDDLVVVGGALEAPGGFHPGGHHVVVGSRFFGGSIEMIVPWLTRGLLWGRPIVPDVHWVWPIVGLFFLVYLLLSLVFDRAVGACAERLADKPLTTFLVGLLVLLLAGPVCLLLAVSIVGIAVVPFVLCALFVAGMVGRVGVVRWIGMRVVRQDSQDDRLQSLRSFVIGFVVLTLVYMVPVLGFVAWTMVGVFGLGAATLAFIVAYRRENPAPPKRTPAPDPQPPAPGLEPVPAASNALAPAAYSALDQASYRDEGRAPLSASSVDAPAAASGPAAPAAPAHVSDLLAFPHAAFLDRLAAFALDVILVLVAQELLDLTRRDSAFFLLLLGYHIGFWTWKGTTVGGIICQLRLVRVDGAPLRFVDALVRGLSAIFSLAALGLGGLWILRDPERQAWHDRIAGTYVVKVPRHWPL